MEKMFLLGVGRNTPVFIDLVEQSGYKIEGLYHYNELKKGETDHGYSVLGSFDDLYRLGDLAGMKFLLTMGDSVVRVQVAEKIRSLGGIIPAVIHPTAVVSKFARLSTGVIISPFSFIQADTVIGKDTVILSGVNISHNNSIGEGCFIAGGTTIGAYTTIGNLVFIGQEVLTISQKVENIGNRAYIGAGSLVTKSIAPGSVVAGSPARPLQTKIDNGS